MIRYFSGGKGIAENISANKLAKSSHEGCSTMNCPKVLESMFRKYLQHATAPNLACNCDAFRFDFTCVQLSDLKTQPFSLVVIYRYVLCLTHVGQQGARLEFTAGLRGKTR